MTFPCRSFDGEEKESIGETCAPYSLLFPSTVSNERFYFHPEDLSVCEKRAGARKRKAPISESHRLFSSLSPSRGFYERFDRTLRVLMMVAALSLFDCPRRRFCRDHRRRSRRSQSRETERLLIRQKHRLSCISLNLLSTKECHCLMRNVCSRESELRRVDIERGKRERERRASVRVEEGHVRLDRSIL